MLSVIVVVADCRCHCWGTANYSSILMRGRKSDHGRRKSNPDPERSKPKALQLRCRVRFELVSSGATNLCNTFTDMIHFFCSKFTNNIHWKSGKEMLTVLKMMNQ